MEPESEIGEKLKAFGDELSIDDLIRLSLILSFETGGYHQHLLTRESRFGDNSPIFELIERCVKTNNDIINILIERTKN